MTAYVNVILESAIVRYNAERDQTSYTDVIRQTLQGSMFLFADDVQRSLGSARRGEQSSFDGTTLRAYTQVPGFSPASEASESEIVRLAATAVMRLVIDQRYATLQLDSARATCLIPSADVKIALRSDRNDLVKDALSTSTNDENRSRVLAALEKDGILLQAVEVVPGRQPKLSIMKGADDATRLLLFTSEMEIAAKFPSYQFVVVPVKRAFGEALDKSFAGVVINPQGPWISLDRDDLIALNR